MSQMGIPYDYHCACRHIAASHRYTAGNAIVWGRCHECPLSLSEDVCPSFKADNLVHLEHLHTVKEGVK